MLVVWIIGLCIGLIMVIKAEKFANFFRSVYFSGSTAESETKYRLGKKEGFWKIIGVLLVILSIFLISGGDDLLISKSTDVILESTPKEYEVLR